MERAERWEKTLASESISEVHERELEEDSWYGREELGGGQNKALTTGRTKPNGVTKGKKRKRENGEPVKIHCFSTFFWSKLTTEGYERARLNRWTKKVSSLVVWVSGARYRTHLEDKGPHRCIWMADRNGFT